MTDQRFAYEPVHDLRTGRFAGVEVLPRRAYHSVAAQARDRGWTARQVAELDASTAVSAIASARATAGSVPIQVDVAADTVLYARDRLRAVLAGGTGAGARLGAVAPLLEVGPPIVAAAPADQLVPAIAELRRWGFRIGLDGGARGFGPSMITAVRPDVVKLEPDLADGVLDAAVGVAVRAVQEVARTVGSPVAATGVRDPDRLAGLYASGVSFAQGPLLGGLRPTPAPATETLPELLTLLRSVPAAPAPGTPPAPDPPAVPGDTARPQAGPPVRALATPAVTLPDDVTGDLARQTLGEHPDAAGIVLVDDGQHPVGYLDRSRFLLHMTGRFGYALWADKSVAPLADAPRTIDERAPLGHALEFSLSGDPARGYDDLVVVAPDGTCRGVVAVAELWRWSIRPSGPEPAGAPSIPARTPHRRRAPVQVVEALPGSTGGHPVHR